MQIDSLEVKIKSNADSAITSLDRLEKKLMSVSQSLSSVNGNGLQQLASGVTTLGNAVNQIKGIDSRTFTTLANNINKLGNVKYSSLTQASTAINMIASSVGNISGLSGSIANISSLASAIRQLGYKSVDTAITNMPRLASAMNQLMSTLSKAPTVSANLIQMTQALANLSNSGYKFSNVTPQVQKGFNRLNNSAKSSGKSFKGLAYYFGKFYATYFLLLRAFSGIKKAIDISSTATELENVVANTFGDYEQKLTDFTNSSVSQYGMSEITAKQVASRFQAMGVAMGFSTEKMSDMSIELTKLTSDLASFYDESQSDVAEALQSGIMTGQTRPLRKYGLDLTQATLKEWALKNGLDADISSMTQAEKTMLRYQYVLAQTKNVQGDFARTADSWHNQVTILKANLQQLGKTWGDAFVNMLKPALQYLNTALIAFTEFSEKVVNALGKIFGWKIKVNSAGLTTDIEDAEDSMEDLGGATDDETSKVKKLKQQLQGIDQLNNLTTSSSSGSSGDGGDTTNPSSDLDDTGWEFEETEKLYESSIKNLYELGKTIGTTLKESLENIDWDSIQSAAEQFGIKFASFLNGFIDSGVITSLGPTLAEAINTVLYEAKGQLSIIKVEKLGSELTSSFQKGFETINWSLVGETFVGTIEKSFDFVAGLVQGIDWEKLPSDIVSAVKGVLTGAKWSDLFGSVGNLAGSLLKAVFDLAKGIAEVFADVDQKILKYFVKKIQDAGFDKDKGLLENGVALITGMFNGIIDFFKGIKEWGYNNIIKPFVSGVLEAMGVDPQAILDAGSDLINKVFDGIINFVKGIGTWIKTNVLDPFISGFATAIGTDKESLLAKGSEIIDSIKSGISNALSGIGDWVKDKFSVFTTAWDSITDKDVSLTATAKEAAGSILGTLVDGWKTVVGAEPKLLASAKEKVGSKLSELVSGWNTVVGKKPELIAKASEAAGSVLGTLVKGWTTVVKKSPVLSAIAKNPKKAVLATLVTGWASVYTKTAELTATVVDKFTTEFKKIINGAIKGINTLINAMNKLPGVNIPTLKEWKAKGGAYYGGHWKNIDQYASGGVPTHGTAFIAGESGAEVVGHINGRTEVLNQSQMASVMYNAVYNAVTSAMSQNNGNSTTINIDGKEVFRAVQRVDRQEFNRTGTPNFAF